MFAKRISLRSRHLNLISALDLNIHLCQNRKRRKKTGYHKSYSTSRFPPSESVAENLSNALWRLVIFIKYSNISSRVSFSSLIGDQTNGCIPLKELPFLTNWSPILFRILLNLQDEKSIRLVAFNLNAFIDNVFEQ